MEAKRVDSKDKGRRERNEWSTAELEQLKKGYAEFGHLHKRWVLIRKYYRFDESRTPAHLKDKHRGMQSS